MSWKKDSLRKLGMSLCLVGCVALCQVGLSSCLSGTDTPDIKYKEKPDHPKDFPNITDKVAVPNQDNGQIMQAPKKGQTDFIYRKSDKIYTHQYSEHMYADAGMATQDAGSSPASESSSSSPDTGTPPPSGREEKVEEGDLYKVSNKILYYLNTYKGLAMFSLKDPKKPKKIANLPVYGYPIEMFFDKDLGYILIKDALYLKQVNGKFQFERRFVSQLLVVDLKEPAKPSILQRFDIEGQLREGVSRKVGNTVYVVSYTPKYYWSGWRYSSKSSAKESATVYSFDVSDPRSIKKIQSLELIQPNRQPPNAQQNYHYAFSGITISATSNALMVSERWSYNSSGQANGCWRSEHYKSTVLNLIDISDPSGKIRVHTRFGVRGDVTDQFKQTYAYDPKTKRGIYYGIFQRNEWGGSGCNNWRRTLENSLISIDISDGQNPKVLDLLKFGKPNETVRGSMFDHSRKIVYAITAVRTDPLYAISFADPAKLKIMSSIDGLSGDINVFRLIAGGQFLMGIGRDNTGHCTGFEGSTDRRSTQVAVSIIDVRDLSKVRLVQRRCVSIQAKAWISSQLNSNLDQAHKMLGMYSDGGINLVTVPVSYYTYENSEGWWYSGYKTAIGMMRWDLDKYDETKDETHQNVLTNLGSFIHPQGKVKRTILFNMDHDGQKRRYVLNLSETHLSLIDAQDLANPTLLSTLPIAPYVQHAYRFGDYLVEHINGSKDGLRGDDNALQIKKLTGEPIDQLPILKEMRFGRTTQILRWKNSLLLFRNPIDQARSEKSNRPQYQYQFVEIVIYDFTHPEAPKRKGVLKLTNQSYLNFNTRFSSTNYAQGKRFGSSILYPNENNWLSTKQGITILSRDYETRAQGSFPALFNIDLSDLDHPKLTKTRLLNHPNGKILYTGLLRVDDQKFYLNSRVLIGSFDKDEYTHSDYRFYTQAWSYKDGSWTNSAHINIPGTLIKVLDDRGQPLLVTRDQFWPLYTQRAAIYDRMFILQQGEKAATIIGWQKFEDWSLQSYTFQQSRLIMTMSPSWQMRKRYSSSDPRLSSGFLGIYDLDKGTFLQRYAQHTLIPNIQLLACADNRVLFQVENGVLLADISQPTAPRGLRFVRTLGWTQSIHLDSRSAFIAAGHFGVFQIDLAKQDIPSD